jgi:hypothetical protein
MRTWNDGNIELKHVRYDVDQCVERLAGSPLPEHIKEELESLIRGVRRGRERRSERNDLLEIGP